MSDLITTIPKDRISIPQINALHAQASTLADEARSKANQATQLALLIGLKLIALKANTPHGQWEAHFKSGMKRVGKANVAHVQHLDFSHDTARRYIAVSTEIINRRLSADQAKALAEIAAAETLAPADCELLAEITPPETLRQLYLSMGIVKPTRREALAMTPANPALVEEPATDPEPPKPPTLSERIAQRKAEARTYWFGTTEAGKTDKTSLFTLLCNEYRSGKDGRLAHLSKEDLISLSDLLFDLHSITKDLINLK